MKKVSKLLGIVLAVVCMLNVSKFDVSAATYTEEQLQGDEILYLQGGDIIEFEGTPIVEFYDRNGVLLDTQAGSTITLPEYELTSANFISWVQYDTSTVAGVITEISFRAHILPPLYTTTVTEGENVTFSFNESDLPLPHNYTYEWIAGGIAGGWKLDGSTNTTTFTITPDSEYYKDGYVVACRILIDGGGYFFTGEGVVDIIPAENTAPDPEETTPEETNPTPEGTTTDVNPDVVSTGDTSKIAVYSGLLALSAIVISLKKRMFIEK